MGSKSDARTAETVEEVADLWLSTHVRAKRSDGSYEHYRDLLDRIVKTAWGKLKAKSLPRAKDRKLHDDWSHSPFHAEIYRLICADQDRQARADFVKPWVSASLLLGLTTAKP